MNRFLPAAGVFAAMLSASPQLHAAPAAIDACALLSRGEVTAVIEPQKIDVLFGDQTRRLIHAQA